jgi:hypothetical protein
MSADEISSLYLIDKKGDKFQCGQITEKRSLPLYASKERVLAFFGNNVISPYVIKYRRVTAEIEIRPKKRERSLPLYASKQKGLARMSKNRSKSYVDDIK